MNLKDILAISGEQGLFKFIAQGKNAIIVEHLETGRRSTAHGSAKVSSLEDISIFTEKDDLLLGKVFDKIYEKEKGGASIDSKDSADKLKAYFEEIIPEYNKNRVYHSDIKKVFVWYNLLQKLNLLVKDEPVSSEPSEKKPENEPKALSESGKKSKSGPASKVKPNPKPKSKPTQKVESKAVSTKGKTKPNSK
jgi:hypothetical protein